MAMGIDYYSYPPHKTALAWSGESKPPAGTPGAATPGAGGGTQGLAHWMSVMAEHMNHESSLHPAYMWHNGIDQKMSLTEQQQLLQKGGAAGTGEARQDSTEYYSPSARPESAASSSPPTSGAVG